MELQETPTPTPRKSALPYVIGLGIVILLAAAAFMAVRYFVQPRNVFGGGPGGNVISVGGPGGQMQTFKLDIKPAKELPATEPDADGLYVERKDNSIFIGTGDVTIRAKAQPGQEPQFDSNFTGPKVEVVIPSDTVVYKDTTELDPENLGAEVQQTVELSTIDEITEQSSIRVWGRKARSHHRGRCRLLHTVYDEGPWSWKTLMIKFDSIRWRLTLSYAAIALLAAFSLGLVLRTILRNYYAGQETRYLQSRAIEIGSISSQLLEAGLPAKVFQDLSRSWSFVLQARVQVLDGAGHQIADSGTPAPQKVFFIASERPFELPFGQSVTRPVTKEEFGTLPPKEDQFFQIQVLRSDGPAGVAGQKDVIIFNRESVGVALPADVSMNGLLDPQTSLSERRSTQIVEHPIISSSGNLLGKVILSAGPAYGDEILNNVMNGWILAGIAAVLLAALAGWWVSARIATPLTELTSITSRMTDGDLSARADVRSGDEFGILGRSFNEMAARVEETVGTLRSFVADAAHELHTPLTALQANIELARDEKNASARTRYLARAHEQSQRLEGLVQSLLDLSRIEAAESKFALALVDFTELMREVGEQFASRAEQADCPFSMNVPEDAVQVLGNETQLRQVIINLLENALKFTPQNGRISLDLEHSSNQVILTISDSGIGIPPEDLPHLFERFHRGRNASEYPGNGLGLAIVKAIVSAHKGDVTVQSESMQGTSISVSLPLTVE